MTKYQLFRYSFFISPMNVMDFHINFNSKIIFFFFFYRIKLQKYENQQVKKQPK